MAAAAKPAKPAYELSGWERFKKDVVRDKWLYLLILPGMPACFSCSSSAISRSSAM